MSERTYRLCKCLTCGNTYNQGTFEELGMKKPHPHHHFNGTFCGEMVITNG